MVLMCIDHARDYTGLFPTDPMSLAETPFWLYLLRILSHLCAPTFIFLAGISMGISGERKSKRELSVYLITRGAVLCLLELTLVNWGWSFNPLYGTLYLQVIWAIGVSMIAMGALIHLGRRALFLFALTVLFTHNLFSSVRFETNTLAHYLWSFLLQKNLLPLGDALQVRTTYPILPVLSVMCLGYWVSAWYTTQDSKSRSRKLLIMAISMIGMLLLCRLVLNYGDTQAIEWGQFARSFANLTKYPLSLDFVLLYLSFPILFLALSDQCHFGKSNPLMMIGQVPMFFYILHLYVLHCIILLYLIYKGFSLDFNTSLGAVPANVGFPAWWLWWVVPLTVLLLLLPCKYYSRIKQSKKYPFTKYI